ncbi:MAG: UDP-glucose/GDP-mannose dehydrogenase family protein [Actinomycetota bacterium]
MSARIAVIGTGYVGLSSGVCMAHLGHEVACVDIDASKVERLSRGEPTIVEHRLGELLEEGLASRRLRFTTDLAGAVRGRQFVFMCVQTPQGDDGAADLTHLKAALTDIAPHLAPGAIVVNKSTVPVGTARMSHALIGRDDVKVASNPEFLREGTALDDFLSPDRVVVGCDDRGAALAVADLYAALGAKTVITNPETSETIKYAANAFLAMKLSFINDVAALCEAIGADVRDVSVGLGHDRRIGADFLKPGPGWGGSCFPKDSRALVKIADQAGYQFDLLRAAIDSNERQYDRITHKVVAAAGGSVRGIRVGVWGLTFKAGTDDLRDSPSLEIVRRLVARGALLTAFDPTVHAPHHFIPEEVTLVNSAVDAADGAELLVVLTEWPDFIRVHPSDVAARMPGRVVVDGRNLLDRDVWQSAGFRHLGIGR